MKPHVAQSPEDIAYQWPEAGVGMTFSHIREASGGAVRGYLTIQTSGGAHIWWALVTLTGTADRKTAVDRLQGYARREVGGWERDVDRCFHDAVRRTLDVEPHLVDLATVDAPADPEFLYQAVLPSGQVTLFLADQGSTKSYLMQYLSACTALGLPSVFGKPAQSGPVAYFDWEVDEKVARRRLEWICNGLGMAIPEGLLLYVNMANQGRLAERARWMRREIDRVGAVAVVVDSLTFASGGDINSGETAGPVTEALGRLGPGVTKIVAAHPNKSSRSGGQMSAIGSALYEYRARAIWVLKREQSAPGSSFTVAMEVHKPFDGMPRVPLAYRVTFDNEQRAVRFTGTSVTDSAELMRRALPIHDQIRRELMAGSASVADLAGRIGSTTYVVAQALHDMRDVIRLSGESGPQSVWGLRMNGRSYLSSE